MLARPGRAAALAGLLVIVAVCGPTIAEAADPADDGQTLDVRRLSSDQRRRLLAGETITYAVPETSDSMQPLLGHRPGHGGPSMSTTKCPSSAAAPREPR